MSLRLILRIHFPVAQALQVVFFLIPHSRYALLVWFQKTEEVDGVSALRVFLGQGKLVLIILLSLNREGSVYVIALNEDVRLNWMLNRTLFLVRTAHTSLVFIDARFPQ